jgi:hypothetical protein
MSSLSSGGLPDGLVMDPSDSWLKQPQSLSQHHQQQQHSQLGVGAGGGGSSLLGFGLDALLDEIPRATSAPPHLQDVGMWGMVSRHCF